MFLFLSKLLPALIYPLGFACLMLLLALITLWKRPRIASVAILLALLALLLPGNARITGQLLRSLEWQNLPSRNLPQAEAIVVLGGGIKPQLPPRPWVDVAEAGDRTLYGAQLYKQGKAPLVILSGGRIEWQGGGPPESGDMAKIVQALGVPRTAILEDPTSLNTHENAVNVKKILQARQINRVLLVTSALHMPRSLAIFQKQGIEAIPAPTDFLSIDETKLEGQDTAEARILGLIPEAENLHNFTRALKEYIGLVVYRLRGWL